MMRLKKEEMMREQYVWPAGTPVLMLGYGCGFPTPTGVYGWKTAAAGRLEEPFRPGGAVLMREGPLATSLPARGWKACIPYRDSGWVKAEELSDREYDDHIHGNWKGSFVIIADKDTQDHLGARCFTLLRSDADLPDRRKGIEHLVERLERLERPGLHDLLPFVSEIYRESAWHFADHPGWHFATLDERGEPLRRIVGWAGDRIA